MPNLNIEVFTPEQWECLRAFRLEVLRLCAHEYGVVDKFVVRKNFAGETIVDANVYCSTCDARYSILGMPIRWPSKDGA